MAGSRHTKFRNLYPSEEHGFFDALKFIFGIVWEEKPGFGAPLTYTPSLAHPDIQKIHNPDHKSIQITWIGHSTFLIQTDGVNILTDPILSKRASPIPFLGPKRHAPPGMAFVDLPPIHRVMISHNHYDHLDLPTVRKLSDATFFVPSGLKPWFTKYVSGPVAELDWWESANLHSLRVHSVPAQHLSGRGLKDKNLSHWSGWIIETGTKKIFFAGDTGYSPHIPDIAKRFPEIDISLLPIGAYCPRWFMRPMHVNPEEAVRVHRELRSKKSIGMHWGTFKLSTEPISEPPIYLRRELQKYGISNDDFIIMKIGETRDF